MVEEAYADANRLLKESIATYRAVGLPNEQIMVLTDSSVAAWGMGELAKARQHLCEARRMADQVRADMVLILMLPIAAILTADLGESERAVELYALALRYPFVAQSRWFDDVFGQRITTVAAALRPEVVAAARERGRSRDLEATVAEVLDRLEAE